MSLAASCQLSELRSQSSAVLVRSYKAMTRPAHMHAWYAWYTLASVWHLSAVAFKVAIDLVTQTGSCDRCCLLVTASVGSMHSASASSSNPKGIER